MSNDNYRVPDCIFLLVQFQCQFVGNELMIWRVRHCLSLSVGYYLTENIIFLDNNVVHTLSSNKRVYSFQ